MPCTMTGVPVATTGAVTAVGAAADAETPHVSCEAGRPGLWMRATAALTVPERARRTGGDTLQRQHAARMQLGN